MTQADALLAAVIADPDDDLRRLVFADWLDEDGQPERAEFIRVQCELARHAAAKGTQPSDVNPYRGALQRNGRLSRDAAGCHGIRPKSRIPLQSLAWAKATPVGPTPPHS